MNGWNSALLCWVLVEKLRNRQKLATMKRLPNERRNSKILSKKGDKMGKVMTIGELMLRLTPKNKKLLNQASEFNAYYGGAEANVAMSLSKLGHTTGFLSVLPPNDIGDAAIAHLASS